MNPLGLRVDIKPFFTQLSGHFRHARVFLKHVDVVVQLNLGQFLVKAKHQHAREHHNPKRPAAGKDGFVRWSGHATGD